MVNEVTISPTVNAEDAPAPKLSVSQLAKNYGTASTAAPKPDNVPRASAPAAILATVGVTTTSSGEQSPASQASPAMGSQRKVSQPVPVKGPGRFTKKPTYD